MSNPPDYQRAVVAAGDSVDDGWLRRVTRNLFPLLGAKPARGRLFRSGPGPAEDGVVVVSHQFWETTLAGRSLEDATILINDQVYTVIGVMPPAMTYPSSSSGGA